MIRAEELDIFCVDAAIWVALQETHVPVYDFDFGALFPCSHSRAHDVEVEAIGQFGVTDDYRQLFDELRAIGVRLVHSPADNRLLSELPLWYPLLEDLTPRSMWFPEPPDVAEIERHFSWPVFLKGSRQTSRHSAELAIVRSAADYRRAIDAWRNDSILHWQQFVCREFVPLRPVNVEMGPKIPASFEFRAFWWRGRLAAAGPYFGGFADYSWTASERSAALEVAGKAAARLSPAFIVVDVAQTIEGKWIVIEVNDAQESGRGGVNAVELWQNVIALERERIPRAAR